MFTWGMLSLWLFFVHANVSTQTSQLSVFAFIFSNSQWLLVNLHKLIWNIFKSHWRSLSNDSSVWTLMISHDWRVPTPQQTSISRFILCHNKHFSSFCIFFFFYYKFKMKHFKLKAEIQGLLGFCCFKKVFNRKPFVL